VPAGCGDVEVTWCEPWPGFGARGGGSVILFGVCDGEANALALFEAVFKHES